MKIKIKNIIFFFLIIIYINIINYNNLEKLIKRKNKIYKYINLCQKGILINKIKKIYLIYKITAIISLYNSEKTIKNAIRSIQNQKMKDIEIILVDDNSRDNSINIIEELQRNDLRIKIIKNKKNRGPLYSKSIGVLKSKGQYLMLLDSDDLFTNEKLFNICFKEVKDNNIDILEFSGFCYKNILNKIEIITIIPRYLRFKKNNQIIKQPYLSNFIYKKKNNKIIKLIDGFLWGKCIKNDIYKKSLNILGVEVYNQHVSYGDDRIVNFILFKVALSFKFIQQIGIIYNINNRFSIMHKKNRIKNCHDELINIMTIYNLTKNSKEIEIVIYEIKHRWKWLIVPGLNKENKIFFRDLLKKIINNKYVYKRDKIILNSFLKK